MGLVPLKGGFSDIDMDLPPFLDGIQALGFGGGDNFGAMNPGSPQK